MQRMCVAFKVSGLKKVFEKLRFRDGILWMLGLAFQRNEAVFSNFSCVVWTGPDTISHLLESVAHLLPLPLFREPRDTFFGNHHFWRR